MVWNSSIKLGVTALCGLWVGVLPMGTPWAEISATQLTILTWSDYIDPEVVAEFQEKTGYQLNFTYFETDETREDYLIATDGKGYDLIMINGYTLNMYQQRGWLAPITTAEVPNLRHIDSKWLPDGARNQVYGVPYFLGTLGIAYRTDLVTRPILRWMDLFAPAEELQGRIVMIKHSRDLIGMAMRALGYSASSLDPQALTEVRELLLQQRPYVKTYSYVSVSEDSSLVQGTVWAAQIYSGDALMLQELNPNIRYVVPEEGTNLWIDNWVVAAKSENKPAAFAFIDFINKPENAAKIAEYVNYATPNLASSKLLPDSHHTDPIINPPSDVLERSEDYRLLPPRIARKWNAVFAEIVN